MLVALIVIFIGLPVLATLFGAVSEMFTPPAKMVEYVPVKESEELDILAAEIKRDYLNF